MFTQFRGPAALTIAALLLAACATPAERQLHKVSLASEQLWAEYDVCINRVQRTAAYQRLNQAYILRRDDPRSVEKMAIERLASDQEKADLLQNKKNTDRCNQELFKGFAEINPGFNVLLARFMSEDDALVLQTVQDSVTVGARNQVVHQRYAKRLRDWNFAGERIVRLYTWRLRRTCSIYCSSFSAASLLPTSTEGISNLAGVTPWPPADGQAAGLPQFGTTAEPPTQAAATAATPAAQEPTVAATPTALEADTTPQPAPPPRPVTAAAPAAQEKKTIAQPAPPKPAPPKPVTAAAPAAREAETTAKPATQTTGSALKPPTREVDTGLKPAAGPAVAPEKPKKQQAQIASTPKTAKPRYTVHLASMQSEVEARAEWGHLQARYPAILGDRVLFTREVDVEGKGTFVRVLTGLFRDRDQAKGLCGQLGGGKQYCKVMRL